MRLDIVSGFVSCCADRYALTNVDYRDFGIDYNSAGRIDYRPKDPARGCLGTEVTWAQKDNHGKK
jgi:hypothetical protein